MARVDLVESVTWSKLKGVTESSPCGSLEDGDREPSRQREGRVKTLRQECASPI